jgi:hypothetical protein
MSGVCNGTSCGAACTADSQCQPGFFCDAGNCRTKRPVGGSCTGDGQCASAHCADGVCCATACPQACYACDLAATRGSCVPVPDGMDPDNECQAEPATSCGRLGGCNGRGACRLHPATTQCGAPSCTGAMASNARTCNGTGQCQTATTTACGNYRCQGTACGTRCTGNADCQTGFVCIDNACSMPPVAKIAGLVVHDTAHAGDWSIQKNFQIGSGGAHPWTDWPASYVVSVDMAAGVIGAEWIKVAAESKKYTGGPQATLTLGGTVDVYLAIDDRWGGSPPWLAGWSNTGLKMQVFESGARPMLPFTLWRKSDQSGTLTLPQIGASPAYDYFVIVN